MTEITLYHYIILALIVFLIGFIGLSVSRNMIKVLICIEIMMSAINLNFIAFTSFKNYVFLSGMVFALFITAISALQSAIGLVLLYLIYKNKNTLTSEEIEELKG
ncbi:MAG: NADH-quinone oxidoreductase subunit NuoK [Candidatus Gastranaerophilales bacterium]|nr:NADH-quinone oxidoreductase subunit NuoK [Candidatus Gastranaerophilales bacterium]